MMLHSAFVIALMLKVRAQDVYYITSAFTEWFPVASTSDALFPQSAQQSANPTIMLISEPKEIDPSNTEYPPLRPAGSDSPERPQLPRVVAYSMPPCAVCNCPTCTTTSVFTTMLPDFSSNRPTARLYAVTETYVGMSSLPHFPTPTPIPYGFTTAVETCTECGAQPITGTVITPKTGTPWGKDMAEATGGLGNLIYGAPAPNSGADLPPGTPGATHGLGAQPSGSPPLNSDLPSWITTKPNYFGAVETTFFTSTEQIVETTQAVTPVLEGWDGQARTSGPSAASTSYIQISAAEASCQGFFYHHTV